MSRPNPYREPLGRGEDRCSVSMTLRVSIDGHATAGSVHLLDDGFKRRRVALLSGQAAALSDTIKSQLVSVKAFLDRHGMTVLDPPGEYNGDENYYAVFFADPDGMKLEGMVYRPRAAQKRRSAAKGR